VVQVLYRPPSEKQHQFDFNEVLALILSSNPNLASQLHLRQLDNDTLFDTYINELKLRNLSPNYTKKVWELLSKFKEYLNGFPPSPELAKSFLAQYANRKPRTLYRYAQMIRVFMKWYGEPMDDFKVRVPKTLPPYTKDSDVEKLFDAIENKATHRGCIIRDSLLVALALNGYETV